eukprot:4176948-Amphidinium_carterae.2
MAEAKQLAEKVDKQTKVIEEAVEKRAAFKEELVTVILKIKSLPPDTVQVPKPSPATYLASSSALEQLLECASKSGDPQAKALAEKVDQERKATASQEVSGEPALPLQPQRDAKNEPPNPVLATGQRDRERTPSPGRGSPVAPEQGSLADLRMDTDQLTAVPETPDRRRNGRCQRRDSKPRGQAWRGARRRRFGGRRGTQTHPCYFGCRRGPTEQPARQRRPRSARATAPAPSCEGQVYTGPSNREYPEATLGDTDSPQGTGKQRHLLPGRTGGYTFDCSNDNRVRSQPGRTGCDDSVPTCAQHNNQTRPGGRPRKKEPCNDFILAAIWLHLTRPELRSAPS